MHNLMWKVALPLAMTVVGEMFTLVEDATHVTLPAGKRKAAFTLAEVLITLGIIGVVAALTMPVLVQNYREKETVTKLKKLSSVISQAYTTAVQEKGIIDTWQLAPSWNEQGAIDVQKSETIFKCRKRMLNRW